VRTLIVALLAFAAASGWAADQTWDGGSGADSDWSTDQNWGNNNEPNGATDGATMAGSTRLTPNLDIAITLNRLTFAAGAGNFTIGGANALTMGGSGPLIEVLAGTQTISSQFALGADLTIYVASGASLSITDASIAGAFRITKVGPGTLTVTDSATPGAPTFSAPASNGLATADTTPTWTWASAGGGTGVFSYRLNGGAWADTTTASFTPGVALGNGLHTLEVREYSRLGAVSATASRSWSVDGTVPVILSRTTRDGDGNGQLDGIDVLFNEDMDQGAARVGTWTVQGYAVATPVWVGARTLRLPLTELSNPDTGALPLVRHVLDAGDELRDLGGNFYPTEGAGVLPSDGAAPVMVLAKPGSAAQTVIVEFSEPVVTTALGAGDLVSADFAYNGNAGNITGFTDAVGLDRSVTINVAVAVSAGDLVNIPGSSIFDLSGNAAVAANETVVSSLEWYSPVGGSMGWFTGTWYRDAARTQPYPGGLAPNSPSDAVFVACTVVIDSTNARCGSLTLATGGIITYSGSPHSAYIWVDNNTDGRISATGNASIQEVGVYTGVRPAIFTVAGGATLTITSNNNFVGTYQFFYIGTMTKEGAGTLEVAMNPAGYSGATTVNGGTLRLLRPRDTYNPFTTTAGTTLELGVDQTTDGLNGAGTVTAVGGARQLTVVYGTFAGAIQQGTGMSLAVIGELTLSGSNTFTGGATVQSGATLRLQGGAALADACPVALNGSWLVVDKSETVGSVSVTSVGRFQVASGNELSIAGNRTFAADWYIEGGGTVALTGGTTGGAGQARVESSSTLRFSQAAQLSAPVLLTNGTLSCIGDVVLTQPVWLLTGGGTIEVASSRVLTLSGDINGVDALRKSGAGTVVIASTANQASTTVYAGAVVISADSHLGTGGAVVVLDGGTLATATNDITTSRPLSILSAGGTLLVPTGRLLTWSGAVTGAGRLGKAGAGTVALTSDNSGGLTGAIGVDAGVMRVTNAGSLGATAQGTAVADGAALELVGAIAIAEPLTLSGAGPALGGVLVSAAGGQTLTGAITVQRVALPATISVGAGTLAMQGQITGDSGISKIGAGSLSITNTTNSFTGQVSVGAGVLAVGSGAAVAANGCLGAAANEVLLSGGTLRALVSITGTNRIVRIGTAGGTIDANNATVTLRGIDTSPGQDLTLTGPGTIAFVIAYDEARNLSGRLLAPGVGTAAALDLSTSGAGTDPGTLVIANAANTWDGTCTVSSGRLVVNGQAPGPVAVAGGATIAGSGTVGDLTVATGATVSPGALLAGGASTPGVLRAASLQIATGAFLRFELGTANDLLSVDGAAIITGTPARPFTVTGSPSAVAFNGNAVDYVLVSAGSLTYDAGAVAAPTYGTGITTGALYRVAEDGESLVLQRNRAPVVSTGVADAGGTGSVDTTTTPPSYDAGPPGSIANLNDDVAGSDVIRLVQAVDPEGAAAADLLFTLRLDPSQGVIEWDSSGAGAWQTVSADGPITTWTQADIDANRVRYRSTGTVGGNDAILYDVRDAFSETSPLYLMRFTIEGNGPPVVANTPATAVWSEQAAKPGPWAALAPAATVQDSDTPVLDGGLLQVTLLNPESGDEIAFVGNGVTVAGGSVAVSGVAIGTLVSTASDLTVTLNGNATVARVAVLLQAASFRTSNSAPVAVQRSVRIQARDGTVGGGTTIVAFPLNIDLFNDAPDLALEITLNGSPVSATAVPCVPGLERSGRVVPSDPEGESAGNMVLALSQSTLQGTLSFTPATGEFTYTPNFLPGSLATDVLEDSFTITVTDRDFSVSPAPTRADGTGAAARYDAASRQVVVPIRIAAGGAGGAGLAFTSVPRMTVDPGTAGSFSFTPQMRLPSGVGTVTFELIDPPAGVTLGTGSGEINFNPATGAISWPAVPAPAGPAPGYWRFGILATDPATGSATLLPVMLRVGSGGTNG
jgi:autotransporter-associated beta strand protein